MVNGLKGTIFAVPESFYDAISIVKSEIKNPNNPNAHPVDSLGNEPIDIVVFWIGRVIEGMYLVCDLSGTKSTAFDFEPLEALDRKILAEMSAEIRESIPTSHHLPENFEIRYLGGTSFAALEKEYAK